MFWNHQVFILWLQSCSQVREEKVEWIWYNNLRDQVAILSMPVVAIIPLVGTSVNGWLEMEPELLFFHHTRHSFSFSCLGCVLHGEDRYIKTFIMLEECPYELVKFSSMQIPYKADAPSYLWWFYGNNATVDHNITWVKDRMWNI